MTSSSAARERREILQAYLQLSAEDFQAWLYERCGHVIGRASAKAVHHRDGNPANNDVANLELVNVRRHI